MLYGGRQFLSEMITVVLIVGKEEESFKPTIFIHSLYFPDFVLPLKTGELFAKSVIGKHLPMDLRFKSICAGTTGKWKGILTGATLMARWGTRTARALKNMKKLPSQEIRILNVLRDRPGQWINGQYFLREMMLSQYHRAIYNLQRKPQFYGYVGTIEASPFVDEHGFKSYRLILPPPEFPSHGPGGRGGEQGTLIEL